MEESRLELLIGPAPGAMPIRLPVSKAITTIGADPAADVRLLTVAEKWLVVHRDPLALTLRLLATGEDHRLRPGDRLVIDGVSFVCDRGESLAADAPALERLASALASVESAEEALGLLLDGAMAAARAGSGAIIVSEDGAYRVAVARNSDGSLRHDAVELLSDTIVRDVLGSGQKLCLADLKEHERYARVPSVISKNLHAALCLPMRFDQRTLGALYLGKEAAGDGFGERLVAELTVLAALAVPFLAQLRRAQRPASAGQDTLLGESPAMVEVRRLIERVAPSDLSLLLLGASGTGKELVARAVHTASKRREQPLVALNCASVPESLLAAELFGYRRGAFTGATTDRGGLIESANGSTLFLDEVGDMPLAMQAALLRVIEQREVKRLGETRARVVDFRLIAATNRDLGADVAAGRFREDLLFRLQELTIELPALADRGEDILLLAGFFLRQAETHLALTVHSFGADATAALRAHRWPGNVRELRATMRRAAVLADHREICAPDLRLDSGSVLAGADPLGDTDRPLAEARDAYVRDYVARVLDRCGGDREAAAERLQIGVRTLYRYLA